jgi:hypothetical protein
VTPTGSGEQRLWTQREAAAYLGVTPRYLRDSSCPKMLLPGNGAKHHPVVRYDPTEVKAWARSWHTGVNTMRASERPERTAERRAS